MTERKRDAQGQPFVVGRSAFERISAVEGIVPNEGSRRRAVDFERRGLTAEERRREIIAAHAPKD